jgi:hypothetical protein
MPKPQVIKLKKLDIDRALVSGLRQSAWEAKKSRLVREQVHPNQKRQEPRHKKQFAHLDEEF